MNLVAPFANPTDAEIRRRLAEVKTIAVVGLSDDPGRSSFGVSEYMQETGHRIIPVNPRVAEVLGERAHPRLADVPGPVDLVNIFRRAELCGVHVDEAIACGARGVWMQLGVIDVEAAERARKAGLWVVMDRCLMVEHRRLVR